MKIRAVIVDVYATLLEVGPPPTDAAAQWQRLFVDMLGSQPRLSRLEFSTSVSQVIARRQAEARSRAIQWPEIVWSSVVLEVLPELARLSAPKLEEFLLRQMQLGRTLRLADHAAECLGWLHAERCALGIASNSQNYTLHELNTALRGAGLNRSIFELDLCFWSFEHGFSKPDSHVFRILTTRLEIRGIRPAETLMVGDRLDNDIEPARAQGWQAWHLASRQPVTGHMTGNWHELLAWLRASG